MNAPLSRTHVADFLRDRKQAIEQADISIAACEREFIRCRFEQEDGNPFYDQRRIDRAWHAVEVARADKVGAQRYGYFRDSTKDLMEWMDNE